MTRTGIDLKIAGLTKSYGGRRVLRNLDLEVSAGEFLAIVGRSGCGKSTLLRLIAGLEPPDAGAVSFDRGASVDARSAVRMIFQDARLLPWATVLSNVSLGVRPAMKARALSRERDARARGLLGDVGLADRASEWPGRLSGGQRQRVALARGLMSEPRLLLLDEPLGALDALTRLEMQQLVSRLWQTCGFTAVLVTHEIQEAVALADRVVVLDEGVVVADETIAIPRPRAPHESRFVDTATRLLGRILGTAPSSLPPATAPVAPDLTGDPVPERVPRASAMRDEARENPGRV